MLMRATQLAPPLVRKSHKNHTIDAARGDCSHLLMTEKARNHADLGRRDRTLRAQMRVRVPAQALVELRDVQWFAFASGLMDLVRTT
jgi:hypothetical protein